MDETERRLKRMERHLTDIYTRANKEIGETWKAYMSKAGESLKPLQDDYEAAKRSGDPEAIRKAGKALGQKQREVTLMDKHYRAMTEQLAQELSNVNKTAAAYINNQLPDIYALNYNDTANGIKNTVDGISFELVDANTVKRLATTDETLLPYKYVDGKKDVRWNTQRVNAEVLQGIIQGESIPKISKRLSNVTEMNRTSAVRNARTAVTGAENRGRIDMLHNAKDKGVDSEKVWLAAHDARVRDSHKHVDGEHVGIDDEFSNGLQYPGDPQGNPAEVYNCRCTLTYKVLGFGEVANKENVYEQATDRESAYRVLTEDVGFYEVSDSLKYIDDETIAAQANQLSLLNGKFHAIGDNYTGYVTAENTKSFVAATRGGFTNPDGQSLIFSNDYYAHGFDKVINDVKKDIASGWSMPSLESNYGVYSVTHEYGHILENSLMSNRIDMDKYNAAKEKIGFNVNKLNKLKKDTGNAEAKEIFSEIVGIAKENNPNFSIRENLSEYGRSNYQEAFAEVFANSQLGKPNELGNAMNEWLKRQGF